MIQSAKSALVERTVEYIKKYANDEKGTWLAALTPRERHFREQNLGRNLDLGQSGKPIVGSPHEDIFTLVAGMGLIWHTLWGRPFTPEELAASQGCAATAHSSKTDERRSELPIIIIHLLDFSIRFGFSED